MKWLGRRTRRFWSAPSLGFDGAETGLEAIRNRVEVRRGQALPHPDWLRSQAEENVRRGAPESLREKVATISAGRGVVVLAGQQVALHGGPLYSIYKLITATALAERLERELEMPVLPVFWSVSDDADFGEVATSWLARPRGRLIKLRDKDLPPSGTRIGTLAAARQREVLNEHLAVLNDFPFGKEVLHRLDRIAAETENWVQFQTALFHQILSGTDVLILDGGDPNLLADVSPWLESVGAPDPLRRDLVAGAEVSRSLNLEPSFEPDLAERALFRLSGDLRLSREGGPTAGPLAPNVVLRPLLQDYVLPNVATVCGPSEIRYRAQLGAVYRNRGVTEPLRIPRLSAVLLPTLAPHRQNGDLDEYLALLADPKKYVQKQIEDEPVPEAEHELVRLRELVRAGIGQLVPEFAQLDPSLPQLIESAAGKSDYQFERMLEAARGKRRQQLLKREPTLAALTDWIRPRDREQERVLSALMPIWLEGWDAFDPTVEVARRSVESILAGSGAGMEEREEIFLLDPILARVGVEG